MEENPKQDSNQRLSQDAPIMIISDSIIKDIIPGKVSKRVVKKSLYSGKTTEEVSHKFDHVKIDPLPSHVILHVATNNLPNDSAEVTAKKIAQLAE